MITPRAQPLRFIIDTVAASFGATADDLRGYERGPTIDEVRSVAMHLCRLHTQASLAQIGRAFGRDHSTVLSNTARVRRTLRDSPDCWMTRRIETLEKTIVAAMFLPQLNGRQSQSATFNSCGNDAGLAAGRIDA